MFGFDSINIVGSPKALGNWLRKVEEPIQIKLSEKKIITARDDSKVEGCFWSETVPFKLVDLSNYSLLRHQYGRETVER